MRTIFITGGTGYIGRRLINALLAKGDYKIKALVRQASKDKLPPGCEPVVGDALDALTFGHNVKPATIFIHLVGVAHHSPSKKHLFRKIDLKSVEQAAQAAQHASIQHFIYLSVAQHPTEIMKDYQLARSEGEALLIKTGMACTFMRPWYVLGPGHWWPLLLKPLFWIARLIPSYREPAEKLNTVTIRQMITALVHAVEHPPVGGPAFYEVESMKSL